MNSIGTLNEKEIHKFVKDYIEPNIDNQEVHVGNYIADIKCNNKIYEVQTKNLSKLHNKLEYYINKYYDVTVVYPITYSKRIHWINPETDEEIICNRVSYRGKIQDAFKEIYNINWFIVNTNVKLKILFLDVDVYKYKDGYGRNNSYRATTIGKYPTRVVNEVDINSLDDYYKFLPDNLPEEFTSKDYQRCSHSNSRYIASGLKVLRELGIITMIGKKGRAYVYRKSK